MMHLLLVKISVWSAWLSRYWQCPVRKLVILFNLVLPISMRILNLLKFQPFKSSFLACLSSSVSLQTLSLLVAITLYSSSLQESICKVAKVFLPYQGGQCPQTQAHLSSHSLQQLCAEAPSEESPCWSPSKFSLSLHYETIFNLMTGELSAWMAARLFDIMVI